MPALTLTMGNLRQKPAARSRRPAIWARIHAHVGALRAFALAATLGACGGAPPTPAPVVPARAAAVPEVEAFARGWGERTLWRVPLRVALPDARAWHASTSGTFTLLDHAATRSRLALRVTLAPRLVRPAECEAEARLARPSLPQVEPSSVVEQRTIAAPPDFDVRLVVGVEPNADGVRGYALAVGAGTSRCYVAAFETESAGPKAAEHVADRLAVVVSGMFETMSVPNADRRVVPPTGVK